MLFGLEGKKVFLTHGKHAKNKLTIMLEQNSKDLNLVKKQKKLIKKTTRNTYQIKRNHFSIQKSQISEILSSLSKRVLQLMGHGILQLAWQNTKGYLMRMVL